MFLFLKKKTTETEAPATAGSVQPLSEFIPYYGHYNPHTLLTKNGELMQIVKIDSNIHGLHYESGDASQATVRNIIRKAVGECIGSDQFSLWIHTLRKRIPVGSDKGSSEPFAAYVHEEWHKNHNWHYQYSNEIYISILHEGQRAEFIDKKNWQNILRPKLNRQQRNAYLDTAHDELNTTVNTLLRKIRAHYKAERLGIVERAPVKRASAHQAVFYSEPMEFLGMLLNLSQHPFPVSECEMGQALLTHALTFGFNAVEAKDEEGHRRFGALLSLKEYREMPPETVDRVLQSSSELIISESFNFASPEHVLKSYKMQKYFFDVSGDRYSAKASGLYEMLQNDKGRATDFGEHQISIMVLADEYKELDQEASHIQTTFADIGLSAIREDIRLEEGFWARLPGNFEFLRRKEIIPTTRLAGLCRLNRFPSGNENGNHWGEALGVIPTTVSSPYFFNFHVQDNGHSVLFDFNSFNDHMGPSLVNFLLTLSLKFRGRMFIFDRHRSARLLCDKLRAPYYTSAKLQLNPFGLEANKLNLSFLLAWCMELAAAKITLEESHKETVRAALDELYNGAPENRHLAGLVAIIAQRDAGLANAMGEFIHNGKYAGMLDAKTDTLTFTQALQAFDMDAAVHSPALATPLFSYLLHRIITGLDGKPTIIVLHNAADLLGNAFFAPRLESLLEMLKQNNVMLLATSSNPQTDIAAPAMATLMKHCATQLFVPDDINLDYDTLGLGLSAFDTKLLHKMDRQKGDVLLKQSGESIGLRIDFADMDDIRAIYASDVKNLIAAGGPFASLPRDG